MPGVVVRERSNEAIFNRRPSAKRFVHSFNTSNLFFQFRKK